MIHIPGKCGAVEIREILENHLEQYDICFKNHVVSTITDGPNVMKKFVRESPVDGVYCLSHALHLAVTDVFYKEVPVEVHSSVSDDFDSGCDENNCVEGIFLVNYNYKTVLDETRNIIKLFKKSPVKSSVLQKYVVEEHKKEISLQLDIVTRWN